MSNYEQIVARYIRTVRANPYIPHEPTEKQAFFLLHNHIPEILYGGSAGGGKSIGLLMAALQYVHVPGYAALLFRRTYKDLALPDAIMDVADQWLSLTDARWNNETKTWIFPSGATLTFGYLEIERHKYRYQSSQFQFIGFDELTQFTETQYTYLFSRLRKPKGLDVPLRMRAASNPGGVGHDWVMQRFITGSHQDRLFIPAGLADNPHLDRDAYLQALGNLDHVTRAQLLEGNWHIRPEGGLFRRQWFTIAETCPRAMVQVRYWDLAATEGGGDWTVGARLGISDGIVYILDIQRLQGSPLQVQQLIKQTAQLDGPGVGIRMEQEPGSSGVNTIDHYARHVLVGYDFRGVRSTGSKIERARPVSAAAEAGNIRLLPGQWVPAFLDEITAFPQDGVHDDQVDAVSGAFQALTLGAEQDQVMIYHDPVQISPI